MNKHSTVGGDLDQFVAKSKKERPGADNHRAYVGPPQQYDFMGATQFRLITSLGLREEHRYLDIGCGSLRAGKFFLQYLLPGRYHGIEPNAWLIDDACDTEIGRDVLAIKQPRFSNSAEFDLRGFETTFDFIVAQSVFSHTGHDLLRKCLAQVCDVSTPRTQMLFTVISEGDNLFKRVDNGMESEGWFYPGCVSFSEADVIAVCAEYGLTAQRLNWMHPRQTWYRAVTDPAFALSPRQMKRMDKGRVLFDDRF